MLANHFDVKDVVFCLLFNVVCYFKVHSVPACSCRIEEKMNNSVHLVFEKLFLIHHRGIRCGSDFCLLKRGETSHLKKERNAACLQL